MLEFISQSWHWSVSGAAIAGVMILLLWFGGEFGVSSNLRTICTMVGAGKNNDFFNFNWKNQAWNLTFIIGAIIGGFIASNFLQSPNPVQISNETTEYLHSVGITVPQTLEEGRGYAPKEIFGLENAFALKNLMLLIIGGFFIGFGTRWAGGCTSGHAISGLSNLQIPSLIAVIGFFIGGLISTWLILPYVL